MDLTQEQTLGLDAYQRGDLAAAIEAFTAARAASARDGDALAEAEALLSLGVAHQRAGQLHDARLAYQEAMALYTAQGSVEGQAKAMGNLAVLLDRSGEPEQAEEHLRRAADLFQQIDAAELEADTLRYLARLQLRRRAFIDALLSYDRALERLPSLTGTQKLLRFLNRVFFRLSGIE